MTATKHRSAWVAVLVVCLPSATAVACRYTVRDVGFIDLGASTYRMYVLVRDDTPKTLVETVKQVSYVSLLDTNIELEVVNVDRQKDHPAMQAVEDWRIESFPAAVLSSPHGPTLRLPLLAPGKPAKTAVESCMKRAATSPKREEILRHIVHGYCLVLLIEGKDAARNRRAESAITAAIDEITRIMDQMPKPTKEPPRLVRLPVSQRAREEVLLWCLGIGPDAEPGPRAAVLYGRARWIGPLFEDEAITQERLADLLSLVGSSCECGLDRRFMLGVSLPLRWDERAQKESVKGLGFDPENPMVKVEVSRILSMGPNSGTQVTGTSGLGVAGYSEQVVEFDTSSGQAKLTPITDAGPVVAPNAPAPRAPEATATMPTSTPTPPPQRMATPVRPTEPPPAPTVPPEERSARFGATWLVVGGMALLIFSGAVFIILRARRRAA